jgi:hypothetical protein
MRLEILTPSAIALALCCVSGLFDAQGFVHASRMWRDDRIAWGEVARSAGGFAVGITAYWMSVRFMQQLEVRAAEIQTSIWFAATIIGVGIASGRFGQWPLGDQILAGAVVLGLGWLVVRSSGAA